MRPIGLILAALLLLACDDAPSKKPAQAAALEPTLALRPGIWTSKAELTPLPLKGAAWIRLLREADQPAVSPNVADQTERTNVRVAAKALVYARTGIQRYRQEVIAACKAVIGTQAGGRTLALGWKVAAYVIAADLVGLPKAVDGPFRQWLGELLSLRLQGRTLRSTHERRPNNWGTGAGASRAAIAVYLADRKELARTAAVFKGWLGDRQAYAGFKFRNLGWQADPQRPVGINPVGSKKQGRSIDGVLPDDMRRGGKFRWPPPRENYVYTALQGALVQATILHRAGYDVWNWQDKALLRAYRWLHEQAHFPAQGDDVWLSHLINKQYGTRFPAKVPARPGKLMGWTDWTHR